MSSRDAVSRPEPGTRVLERALAQSADLARGGRLFAVIPPVSLFRFRCDGFVRSAGIGQV